MKRLFYVLLPLLSLACMSSCVDEEEFSDDPNGNFEALWKIMDEHYCFFDYKAEEYGLDWNEVRARYSRQVDSRMLEGRLPRQRKRLAPPPLSRH